MNRDEAIALARKHAGGDARDWHTIREWVIAAILEAANGQKSAPRYDWSQAPEWAMWAAVDLNGAAYWYELHPSDGIAVWLDNADGRVERADVCPGWRDSLEQRPPPTGAGR